MYVQTKDHPSVLEKLLWAGKLMCCSAAHTLFHTLLIVIWNQSCHTYYMHASPPHDTNWGRRFLQHAVLLSDLTNWLSLSLFFLDGRHHLGGGQRGQVASGGVPQPAEGLALAGGEDAAQRCPRDCVCNCNSNSDSVTVTVIMLLLLWL